MTRYDYDDESMRLIRLRSEGYTKPNSTTYSPDGTTPHQNFTYTYDGVGNVTQIDSSGNNVGIGRTSSLTRTFEYDPVYRLTEATGREYASNPSNPWDYMPAGGNANDPNQTRAYTERYDYDKVGNMKTLTHDHGAGTGTWTRDYVTESTTNRFGQMTSAGGTHQYDYDDAGNLTSENSDRKYEWDARGRMRSFRNQVSGSQATVFAHYTYDGGGQRVQKVVSKDSGKPVHSVYIGGIFEHHERIDGGSVDAEVNHLHVMDDQKRVAIERVGSELDGSNPPTTRYHLGDHLQSSNVVLDGTGTLFNREKYRPFGESSFGSYETKRYRFTGQERDEESSLSYHGARYYAPWTAQWTSPDPKGMVDGTNLYTYSQDNPIRFSDPTVTEAESKSIDGTKPTEKKSSPSQNTSEEQEEENPSFWERLGAGLREFAKTLTYAVGAILHNLIRAPVDIALGIRCVVRGISNIFKGQAGKGIGQIFFGLLEIAQVRQIVDPIFALGGGLISTIQTLAGIEPPGQTVSEFIEQKEQKARSKGPEALKEFKKQKQKLYDMYGENALENARIKTGARGFWAKLGPLTFVNTILIPSETTSLGTVAHEMAHVGQHVKTGMRYASRSLTDQTIAMIEGSRNYAYQYNDAEASQRPWAALDPEQRASFMEWSWRTGDYSELWPAQGGSGKSMWRKHIK